jgi:hypothetical protein
MTTMQTKGAKSGRLTAATADPVRPSTLRAMRFRTMAARPSTSPAAAALAFIALGFAVAACGEDDEPAETGAAATTVEMPAPTGPEATEASPEAEPAEAGEVGELSAEDEAAVAAVVNAYVDGLVARDAEAVCGLFEPGALPLRELPRRREDCAGSLSASIGYARRGGTPVWKRTTISELNEVSVGPDRARVTATVTHVFADRKFPSVEDDVVYLNRTDGGWLLAKPSGTLYRAVGYPEPPLRALTPPED